MEATLTPRGRIGIMVEAEAISPDVFRSLGIREIEELEVWQGPERHPLAEFFDVEVRGEGSGETRIVIDGDVSRVKRIGQEMTSGSIEVRGSAGMHTGERMAGGKIAVEGDVGSWAGMEMSGGLLTVLGDAGDHVGSAYRGSWQGMTNGRIVIRGNARSQLGGGITGGEIIVGGDVENFCGIRQSGGTIVVRGSAVRGAGAEMSGGTLAVEGKVEQISPGFLPSGQEENPTLAEVELMGRFERFTGDYATFKNPKGSLLLKEV